MFSPDFDERPVDFSISLGLRVPQGGTCVCRFGRLLS